MSEDIEWPDLAEGEVLIPADASVLYRQIHPSWLQGDTITSQAFKPTAKDDGKLSTRLASKMSAEDAYIAHTADEGLQSVGTYQVTTEEVAGADLRSVTDSDVEGQPDGHAYIDCRDLARKHVEKAAKKLRTHAMSHGCQFAPAPD